MFGILDWLQDTILKRYAGSIVRHGITALAGVLMSAGFPGAQELAKILNDNIDPLTAALTATLVFLVGLALSFREKKKSEVETPKPVLPK